MKKITLLGLSILSFQFLQAQITITDPDYTPSNPIDCSVYNNSTIANFFDSGGGADYGINENETITVCPDLVNGTKVSTLFGINSGLSWDVDGSDSLYIYDGPSTSATLLGVHNSVTDPTGFTYMAGFSNTSGCLTFRFVSDASTVATGWDANISCANPLQPFTPHITAFKNGIAPDILNPADTGYADICYGDSILFTGSGTFPYSFETLGVGYSQNNSNCTYEWEFSDGTTQTGAVVWFVPPVRAGYFVNLTITDSEGHAELVECKVRVSTGVNFADFIITDNDICLGDTTMIIGGVSASDTVGFGTNPSAFYAGGVYSGMTYLPDGSGVNYSTSININSFPSGQNIVSGSDIVDVCVTMEHSFLGDLEMVITCPTGNQVTLFNAFGGGGGLVPAGFGGGGTFLGQADDGFTNGIPGIGWEYCFDNNAVWGTFPQEFAANNFTPVTTPSVGDAMASGTYKPETNFNAFIGCPVNGNWTIIVRDNQGIDDGFIFEWGITFNPLIDPNAITYETAIESGSWVANPSIINNINDTAIVVVPTTIGSHDFTYEVIDEYGCTYDTTITINVVDPIDLTVSTDQVCAYEYQVSGINSPGGVTWSLLDSPDSTTVAYSPNNNVDNPELQVSEYGTYSFMVTDDLCGDTDTITIDYLFEPWVDISDSVICPGNEIFYNAFIAGANYLWSTGSTESSIIYTNESPGIHQLFVVVTNFCGSASDTAYVQVDDCDIIVPNIITPNGDNSNDIFLITGLDRHPESSLKIFNRFGSLVYESNNYQNDWNGKHFKNGNVLSEGVYYYLVVLDNGDSYAGHITLLK